MKGKGGEKTFGGDESVHYFDCGDGFVSENVCQINYTLQMCSLLNVNYTSIKLLK